MNYLFTFCIMDSGFIKINLKLGICCCSVYLCDCLFVVSETDLILRSKAYMSDGWFEKL